MKYGAIFPTTEIGNDPGAIRDFAQGAEALGCCFVAMFDHVVGSIGGSAQGDDYASADTAFHEPLTTLAAMAAWTDEIELVTAVLVLPQRQAALVAKQAAEVQILSGGRLRLGVGTGWNSIEYKALGTSFESRGAVVEEQITLLRDLWSEEGATLEGALKVAINPRPSSSIPIWFGGMAKAALTRAVRLGDGWFPAGGPQVVEPQLRALRRLLKESGRTKGSFGIQAAGQCAGGNPELWQSHADQWANLGATHLGVSTMGSGFADVAAHLRGLELYLQAVRRAA